MSREEVTYLLEIAINSFLSEEQKAELKKMTIIAFVDFNKDMGDRVAVSQRDIV